ncbi:hypothetical protein SAMN06265346_11375 [Flavobacterium hercynium]|nr:hypothetical protein SAMN06265346_11375 [Flavobacterium hercynium]
MKFYCYKKIFVVFLLKNSPLIPSPDGKENPFVLGFGTKDLGGQQEIAPKK